MEECYSENNICKNEFTNIILDEELKKLVYKEIVMAQDVNSPFYLSKLRNYQVYHDDLKEHFIRFYGKKPTQTDNLAFMLLLSYPKERIERFKNFTDLKLAFNNRLEESDFESSGFTIYQGFGEANCICNENIMYVHIFKNKYSNMSIQLGSVCNSRYGLISKNDPTFKSTCKKINEHREAEKERREGLPEGFYKKEKQDKKQKKEEDKLKKQEEQESKIREKELNKLNKKEPGSFKITNCAACDKVGIYRNDEITICSSCIPCKVKTNLKIMRNSLNIEIEEAYKECVNCNRKFIDVNSNTELCLCAICDENWCLKKCEMCPEKFLKQKTVTDLCCLDCDEKITNCIDCNKKIFKPSERCKECCRRFTNNLCVIKCQECDKEVEIDKKLKKIKKNCSDCYKNNLTCVDCVSCKISFKRFKKDTYIKKCKTCYNKSK
jgi:hypothetical protein